jgi:serine/threonine protein kinase
MVWISALLSPWKKCGRGLSLLTGANEVAEPPYMAPEHYHWPCSRQTDIYAWGLVFLECLTGEVALGQETLIKLVLRHSSGKALDIPEPLAKSPFGSLIAKATAFDVTARYADAEALLHDLEAIDLRNPAIAELQSTLTVMYAGNLRSTDEQTRQAKPRGGDHGNRDAVGRYVTKRCQ